MEKAFIVDIKLIAFRLNAIITPFLESPPVVLFPQPLAYHWRWSGFIQRVTIYDCRAPFRSRELPTI